MKFTGCTKNHQSRKKILTKIECCGAKFAHEYDLGALDPANCFSKKRPKNIFPVTRGPPAGVLATCNCTVCVHNGSSSILLVNFLGHPVVLQF